MQMRCKQVLEYFLKFGFVATMRDYPYKKGQKILVNRKYKAEVIDVFEVNKDSLDLFVDFSSFSNVKSWINKAKELHGKMPRYIVVVRRVNK